jgi:hypothetical protein
MAFSKLTGTGSPYRTRGGRVTDEAHALPFREVVPQVAMRDYRRR